MLPLQLCPCLDKSLGRRCAPVLRGDKQGATPVVRRNLHATAPGDQLLNYVRMVVLVVRVAGRVEVRRGTPWDEMGGGERGV